MENGNVKALSVAGFSDATKKGLKNLFNFNGRTPKTEFLWCFLVWVYEYGQGVDKDMKTALDWYRKSRDKGYENAKKRIEELNVL